MPKRPEKKEVFSSRALDESGKAVFGTPGPGAYQQPTSLRQFNASGENDPGNVAFETHAAFTLPGRHFLAEASEGLGPCGPGPQAYLPNEKLTTIADPKCCFGTSNRSKEEKRFISHSHNCSKPREEGPGPAAYKQRGSRKRVRGWKFGSGSQRPKSEGSYDLGPAAYNVRKLVDGPAFRFAPDELEKGKKCTKNQAVNLLFISKLHSRVEPAEARVSPGPGANHVGNINVVSQFRRGERITFGHGPRPTQKVLLYISKAFEETPQDVPGCTLLLPSTLSKKSTNFGNYTRESNPEQGGNKGGPFISIMHSKAHGGADSPGPQHYKPKEVIRSTQKYDFGYAKRQDLIEGSQLDNPGPGAYNLKQAHADVKFQKCPKFRIASNLRSDFSKLAGNEDVPGPGAYKSEEKTNAIYNQSPQYSMGFTKDRAAFIPKSIAPSPDAYNIKRGESKKGAGYTFGVKDRLRNDGKSLASYRYYSRIHTDTLGMESPGPVAYETGNFINNIPGSNTTRYVFDKSERYNAKEFISKQHMSVDVRPDAPGPGSYNNEGIIRGLASKYKSPGDFTFGKSERPTLAKVAF